MGRKIIIIIALSLVAFFNINAENVSKTSPGVDTSYIAEEDSMIKQDTAYVEEQQESDFQDYLDTVSMGVDTVFWDNKMINSGRFDSKNMMDTAKFILQDTLAGKNFYIPFKNYITSNFGPRRYIFHYGVDIKLFKGDSVHAAMDGVVRVTKYDRRGFGKVVVIRHASGLESIYGHLSKVLVEPNQKVKAGELIGLGGNTGRSTGSHLHLEFRYKGEPFDPNYVIDFEKSCLHHDTLVLTKANFEFLVELRKAKYCTVRNGDNLGKIARRYHTTVTKLCSLNHIRRKTIIRAGRKLRYQ